MKTIIDVSSRTITQIPNDVRPALCLDLDGTIRYSKSGKFINSPDDIALYPGVERRIWTYRNDGFLVFGITNQGGVAFGFKTHQDNHNELDATIALFDQNPFHIIKSCFHHPGGKVEPYNHRSLLRKPGTGMLTLCEVEAFEAGYIVDWDNSIFVGDRPEDKECAENAAIAFVPAHKFFSRCANCDTYLSNLRINHLTVDYAGEEFCSETCGEEWLDNNNPNLN